MTNLREALDRCGIKMRETSIPDCLRENMEERFICIRMNHVSDLTKATIYTEKIDVDGLIKESDEILSKERGEEIKTCTDDYDMLLFWNDKVIAINRRNTRDTHSWCRLFKVSGTVCCVCREDTDTSSICSNCQSVVCHSCNRKITSNECPVCREPNKFTLGNSSPK